MAISRLLPLLASVAMALSLTACSDDSEPSTSENSTTTSVDREGALPPVAELRKVADAYASMNPSALKEVAPLFAEGSSAEAALEVTLALGDVRQAVGQSAPPKSTVEEVDNGWLICAEGDEGDDCGRMLDLQGSDGKIESWTGTYGSTDVTVRAGFAPFSVDGVGTVTVRAAGLNGDGSIMVHYDVRTAGQPMRVAYSRAQYKEPSGRQFSASDGYGLDTLAPGSTSTYVTMFDAGATAIQGTFAVDLTFGDTGDDTAFEVDLRR